MGSVFTLHTCSSASFCLKPSVWRKLLWLPHQALTQVFLHLWKDPACKTAQLRHGIFTKKSTKPSQLTKTKKPHSNETMTTKLPNQKKKKPKKLPKQHPQTKTHQETPASSLLPCDFIFAFSLCSPVQQIYSSNQFLISWVVFYFVVFLVAQMYFSCVKSAHKGLQVSNCPRCLSAATALFLLAELQHCSQKPL